MPSKAIRRSSKNDPELNQMKLHQTLFFRQFTAVLAGLLLALGTFAFVAIPVLTAPASVVRHLT